MCVVVIFPCRGAHSKRRAVSTMDSADRDLRTIDFQLKGGLVKGFRLIFFFICSYLFFRVTLFLLLINIYAEYVKIIQHLLSNLTQRSPAVTCSIHSSKQFQLMQRIGMVMVQLTKKSHPHTISAIILASYGQH